MTTPRLRATELQVTYGEREVLGGVDVDIADSAVTSIVGPNGCGKSTLLKSLSRLLRPAGGQVLLDGRALHEHPTKHVAHHLGLLPQSPVVPEGILVADLVGRGRTPHQGLFGRWTAADHEAVAHALTATGVSDLAEREVDELSGGQRQRVWIAMALAQDTDILLLDEPTTYLDVANQLEVLDLLTELNTTRGTTVVMVLHDLNLAARYSDRLIAMRGGAVLAEGPADEVLTTATMRTVFDVEAHILADPASSRPLVVPVSTRPDRKHMVNHP